MRKILVMFVIFIVGLLSSYKTCVAEPKSKRIVNMMNESDNEYPRIIKIKRLRDNILETPEQNAFEALTAFHKNSIEGKSLTTSEQSAYRNVLSIAQQHGSQKVQKLAQRLSAGSTSIEGEEYEEGEEEDDEITSAPEAPTAKRKKRAPLLGLSEEEEDDEGEEEQFPVPVPGDIKEIRNQIHSRTAILKESNFEENVKQLTVVAGQPKMEQPMVAKATAAAFRVFFSKASEIAQESTNIDNEALLANLQLTLWAKHLIAIPAKFALTIKKTIRIISSLTTSFNKLAGAGGAPGGTIWHFFVYPFKKETFKKISEKQKEKANIKFRRLSEILKTLTPSLFVFIEKAHEILINYKKIGESSPEASRSFISLLEIVRNNKLESSTELDAEQKKFLNVLYKTYIAEDITNEIASYRQYLIGHSDEYSTLANKVITRVKSLYAHGIKTIAIPLYSFIETAEKLHEDKPDRKATFIKLLKLARSVNLSSYNFGTGYDYDPQDKKRKKQLGKWFETYNIPVMPKVQIEAPGVPKKRESTPHTTVEQAKTFLENKALELNAGNHPQLVPTVASFAQNLNPPVFINPDVAIPFYNFIEKASKLRSSQASQHAFATLIKVARDRRLHEAKQIASSLNLWGTSRRRKKLREWYGQIPMGTSTAAPEAPSPKAKKVSQSKLPRAMSLAERRLRKVEGPDRYKKMRRGSDEVVKAPTREKTSMHPTFQPFSPPSSLLPHHNSLPERDTLAERRMRQADSSPPRKKMRRGATSAPAAAPAQSRPGIATPPEPPASRRSQQLVRTHRIPGQPQPSSQQELSASELDGYKKQMQQYIATMYSGDFPSAMRNALALFSNPAVQTQEALQKLEPEISLFITTARNQAKDNEEFYVEFARFHLFMEQLYLNASPPSFATRSREVADILEKSSKRKAINETGRNFLAFIHFALQKHENKPERIAALQSLLIKAEEYEVHKATMPEEEQQYLKLLYKQHSVEKLKEVIIGPTGDAGEMSVIDLHYIPSVQNITRHIAGTPELVLENLSIELFKYIEKAAGLHGADKNKIEAFLELAKQARDKKLHMKKLTTSYWHETKETEQRKGKLLRWYSDIPVEEIHE